MNNIRNANIGPIIVSALSCIVSFFLLHPSAHYLGFNLLANKGIGKFAFITLILLHLVYFSFLVPLSFFSKLITTSFSFFCSSSWYKDFFIFFGLFACLHILFLILGVTAGYAFLQHISLHSRTSLTLSILLGFFVTFLLAWSEETIFRGALYQYLAEYLPPFPSSIIASFIFTLSHNLTAPWALISYNYKLGLGLFLLGLLLNLIYIITGKMYCSMGAHAGLVFIKVFLRRAPVVTLFPLSRLPWWLHTDLRQSFFVHLIFICCIIALSIRYRKIIFLKDRIGGCRDELIY